VLRISRAEESISYTLIDRILWRYIVRCVAAEREMGGERERERERRSGMAHEQDIGLKEWRSGY